MTKVKSLLGKGDKRAPDKAVVQSAVKDLISKGLSGGKVKSLKLKVKMK